ncbi:VOC family protein [Streptomyces poonensis]|uniref:Glyoxalase n=1 Tax=Streptomyces poonensis TaxID=68255 RepID=A0A918UX60_9ACTN|nr:VOC family protein [Streptomyces poonensis]GGZ40095.1 glyoxalase [Streptomyces poonensis]GLJ92867.1 glyoxalase [Streptomyces poonensis]
MTTEGVEGVYLETHNWGKTANFLQALGYKVEFATEEGSGMLRNGSGPYLLLAEVPEDQKPDFQVVLRVPDAEAFIADASLDVVTSFEETHYGTQEMKVRDPDGRVWSLQAPIKK